MKKCHIYLCISLLLSTSNLYAEDSPLIPNDDSVLRIGIIAYSAPYVMQANDTQFYGFDIATMKYICHYLEKRCQYIPLERNDIYTAIANKSIDLAISAIVITPNRAQYVAYSMPYMTSEGQFIGATALSTTPFNSKLLENKKIGVIKNSAYYKQVLSMSIPNTTIQTFDSDSSVIAAIQSGAIDIGFINNNTAIYWQHNSGGTLHVIGDHVPVGFGLGIITNQTSTTLMQDINLALYNYQNSPEFKNNYNLYLNEF